MPKLEFKQVAYSQLNSRQQENYNYHKVSAVLADYGFATIRLSDDWMGADFIANHISGEQFLKVQLKGVLTVDAKYLGKQIWICFRRKKQWYMYPHDEFLRWALKNTNIRNTKGWVFDSNGQALKGAYTWPSPNKRILEWLKDQKYVLVGCDVG